MGRSIKKGPFIDERLFRRLRKLADSGEKVRLLFAFGEIEDSKLAEVFFCGFVVCFGGGLFGSEMAEKYFFLVNMNSGSPFVFGRSAAYSSVFGASCWFASAVSVVLS